MELIQNINAVKATYYNHKLVNVAFDITTKNGSSTKNSIFFGNVERTSNFSSIYRQNKNCLWENNTDLQGHLIRNLYATDACFYKSAIYDVSKTARTETTYDFLNITNHKISADNAPKTIIQVDNVLYALEPKTKYGRYDIKCDIYSYISANTGHILPPNTLISTAIYDYDQIAQAIQKNDIIELQKNAVSANLSNIEYNMIYEIPGNVYNDYESGNIAANTFKCKNVFNSIYNMEHDGSYVLKNARDYYDVNSCNKQVYLTYTDNASYSNNESRSEKNTDGGYANIKCQHVEMLGAMNRYANLNGHKSNLYSIAIYTDVLNCLKSNKHDVDMASIKTRFKTEIQHIVRNIVNKLQPINTLLLSVIVNEVQ